MDNTGDYAMVCPFLNRSIDYASGVRFGMFWEHMRSQRPDDIIEIVKKDDEEQFRLGAIRAGYDVEDVQQADPKKDEDAQDWLVVKYVRTPRADEIDRKEDDADEPFG